MIYDGYGACINCETCNNYQGNGECREESARIDLLLYDGIVTEEIVESGGICPLYEAKEDLL